MTRWNPSASLSRREQYLVGRMTRTGKLFAFLRMHRHELFDEGFQAELEAMYRSSGEGKQPVAPALLAMVVLLQAYTGASDAQAVELAVVDARWQMVLGVLGQDDPPFSQGALPAFRQRLIAHEMDRRLLERTIELARQTSAFDWKKLPKALRVAVDSRPLEGAGRVEDTFNLLAHAARKVLTCAARLVDLTPEQIAERARTPLLVGTSIKAALDIEWSDPVQKASAIGTLVEQLDRLERWIAHEFGDDAAEPPLAEPLATLRQLREQDLDPEPPDGKPRIRKGTVEDRRVSVEDKDMRHGRKSKTKRFNGYKGHIACDLDTDLIVACGITPANRPEAEAVPSLQADIARGGLRGHIEQLSIDRGLHQQSARNGGLRSRRGSPLQAVGLAQPERLPQKRLRHQHAHPHHHVSGGTDRAIHPRSGRRIQSPSMCPMSDAHRLHLGQERPRPHDRHRTR